MAAYCEAVLLPASTPYMTEIIPHLPPLKSNMKILDVGSGPGTAVRSLMTLAEESLSDGRPEFTAVDIVPDMIANLEAYAAQKGWSENVHGVVADASDMNMLRDDEFDVVIMLLALFDLKDPAAGTRELYRVLKPGGTAVVVTWRDSGLNRYLGRTKAILRTGNTQPLGDADVEKYAPFNYCIWPQQDKTTDAVEKGGFRRDRMEIWKHDQVWSLGPTMETFVSTLSDNFWLGILQAEFSDEGKEKAREALRSSIIEHDEEQKGLDMNVWICTAKK